MNEMFSSFGIAYLKPILTAMLLPPVPFILSALAGAAMIEHRRRIGKTLLFGSLTMVWLSCCMGAANAFAPLLLRLPAPLTATRIDELRGHLTEPVAIIVLGSGLEAWAPEYRSSSLHFRSLERLRYGIWLGRRTGWPTGFSGGVGWGQPKVDASVSEAAVAQSIATQEFGRPLRWVESESKDTRENALNTVALLRRDGVKHVVIVTHEWHMPRAMRNFERAARSDRMRIEAAPLGLSKNNERPWMRWIATGDGLSQTRGVVREWLGMLTGA